MGEQIPCPVCTLYLHPGMNLADHLETHPKEQVIKALVALASGAGMTMKLPEPTPLLLQNDLPSIENSHNTSLLAATESKVGYLNSYNRNVMIVNRQRTMVYQSTDAGHQGVLSQGMPLVSQPPMQIFNLPQQNTAKSLPPPPNYGTAVHQIRSQNSPCDLSNNQSHYENTFCGDTSNQSTEVPACRLQSPRLLMTCSRNSSPRPTASPSVLRFAESPVTAHYVERENGDFIVQETPRHVVECVEKDDGEFSVIEKVIKSPPSVVQFHDSDNDNDDSIGPNDYDSNENNHSTNPDVEVENCRCEDDVHTPQKSITTNVTVLSNVKLAPKESIDLIETLIASNNKIHPSGVELLWSHFVEPDAEDIKTEISESFEADETHEDAEQKSDSETVIKNEFENNIVPPPSAATSVIRLATNNQKNTSSENLRQLDKSECIGKTRKPSYTRDTVKRPYKRAPKKIVVKFKNPPLTPNSKDNDENPEPGPSDPTFKYPAVMEEVIEEKKEEMSFKKVETSDDRNEISSEIQLGADEEEKAKENVTENEQTTQVTEVKGDIIIECDYHDELSLEHKESETITVTHLKSECKDTEFNKNFSDMELGEAGMPLVIVHEPSLMEDPTIEIEKEKTEEKPETDKKNVEFSRLLVECMKNNPPESYSIHLSTIESIPETVTESLCVNTNSAGENTDSVSQKNDSMTPHSFPSTSFSKPCFTLREQTDFPSSHSYNDYPFSFLYANNLDKNCLSPIYPSDDQSWHKCTGPTFQQHAQMQISDLDGERSSYIDLDTCKKNGTDIFPSVDTLNIRTDEKMPAKGEISEQESNGEVDLSWGQTLYNESQRFHSQLENYGTRESGSYSNDGFFFHPQTTNGDGKLIKSPSHLESEEKHNPVETKRKERKISTLKKRKSFQCDHCFSIFVKLKDRNTHLLERHNYKRVNRRLVRELPPATVTTGQVEELQQVEDTESVDVKKPEVTAITSVESSHLPRTKYDSIRAGIYRMLMNFNLSILQQNKNIEVDKSLFDSKSFCCYTCKRDFISVKSFDEHLMEHPAECFTCGKKFTRWTYFSIHLKRHLGWKDFACTVCSKKFVVRSALIEHTRMHTGVTPLKCKFCDKHFKRYSNLTQHTRVFHQTKNSKKKDYVCHCGEVLPSKARFLWHKETHDTKPKCCPYCRDRFVHSNSLRRHIRLAHSDKFSYTEPAECPICNQVYAKTSLKAHMGTHSMDTQHECVICNKSFSTKWNLKIHSWLHTNRTAKPFKCDLCVKAFVREVDYKNHMNAHKQIKPYTCEYCGCKFIRKYNYMRHRREHHGQKKFGCDLCGKLFHRHYYLIEHRRTHTGERPFLCTICGKSSTTKTNHNKHLKIHHSRDPFTTET